MAEQLHLEVITANKQLLETDAEWVTLPGSEGELGVLPEHVPVVTTLDTGLLRYSAAGKETVIAVHYGYAQVASNRVTVLPDMAETGAMIDIPRAKRAEQRAREELQRLQREQDEYNRLRIYESKLKRAMVRQSLGE
ncbi:MAG: F0F1 ATP synthase subunit epsilon [Candidatus Lambdaproteobacteria bacterium]|nr:F0F1 ATP synthase subunit epsilon [Candidatus Lambdaproteobacteria bacterium]